MNTLCNNNRELIDDNQLDEALNSYFNATETISTLALKEEQEAAFYAKLCATYRKTNKETSAENCNPS